VFVFYFFVEKISVLILSNKYHNEIGEFFPLEISHRLVPRPAFFGKFDEKAYQASLEAVQYHVGYATIVLIITWAFCFWINNRRDL